MLLRGAGSLQQFYHNHQLVSLSELFLYFEVYKGPRFWSKSILDFPIYTKPIFKFLYLHGRCDHPQHTFTGFINGSTILLFCNTSDKETWNSIGISIFMLYVFATVTVSSRIPSDIKIIQWLLWTKP